MSTDFGSDHHDWHSAAYVGDWIDQDVTRDDQRQPLLHRLATLIPDGDHAEVRILDVGGGYGVLTAAVLDQLPRATVVLHDYSEAMIDKARERLARFGERVSYQIADMTHPEWVDHLGEPFDHVVSALAIHNLGHPEQVKAVYRDIFSLLKPGGCLFNLDLIFAAGDGTADLYRRDPTRRSDFGVPTGPADLEAQLHWLREAGFAEVDCVWKDLDQGLLWGLRREAPCPDPGRPLTPSGPSRV